MTAKETFGSKKISKNLPEINVDRKILIKELVFWIYLQKIKFYLKK